MGELREYYDIMKEHALERRKSVESQRSQHAVELLMNAGYAVAWSAPEKALYVYESSNRNKPICRVFPYTGWWSGKGIGSGRGIERLIGKLKE